MRACDIVATLRDDIALLGQTVLDDISNGDCRIFILEGTSATGKTTFAQRFNCPPNNLSYMMDYQAVLNSKVGPPLTDYYRDKGHGSNLTRYFINQLYISRLSLSFGIICDKIRDAMLDIDGHKKTHIFDRGVVSSTLYDIMFDRYLCAKASGDKTVSDHTITSTLDLLIKEGLMEMPDVALCQVKDKSGNARATVAQMVVILQNAKSVLKDRGDLDTYFTEMFGSLEEYATYQNRWFAGFVGAVREYELRTGTVYDIVLCRVDPDDFFVNTSTGRMISNIAKMA